jgi:hypothetical protein
VADRVELADSVEMALLVVLETLSPLERAVFVLREAFGEPTRRSRSSSIAARRPCGSSRTAPVGTSTSGDRGSTPTRGPGGR